MFFDEVEEKMRARRCKANIGEHNQPEDQSAPKVSIPVNGKSYGAKAESLRRQLLVTIDMDLVHRTNAV